mmetsp:Transcript_102341/g.181727  ORF Transcript_102341/g.181727 Transcript_102341/m.181727 type:complete len:175 (+) Transcript_102341:255-779(+)
MYLLEKGVDPNEFNMLSYNLTNMAAFAGSTEMLQKIIDQGGDVNKPFEPTGFVSALSSAASLKKKWLDSDWEFRTQFLAQLPGTTPLHRAAGSGNVANVNFLLEKRAELNARNQDGGTPLGLASDFGHLAARSELELKGGIMTQATPKRKEFGSTYSSKAQEKAMGLRQSRFED